MLIQVDWWLIDGLILVDWLISLSHVLILHDFDLEISMLCMCFWQG